MFVLGMLAFLLKSKDVADLRPESSFVGFFKPRPKLTFVREPARPAFIPYSATPTFLEQIGIDTDRPFTVRILQVSTV